VLIGVVGDFQPGNVTHATLNASLEHAGAEFEWIPTDAVPPPGEIAQRFSGRGPATRMRWRPGSSTRPGGSGRLPSWKLRSVAGPPLLEHHQRRVHDPVLVHLGVVQTRELRAWHVDFEEAAQRLPSLGDAPHE
jgi:hypothetical protein